METKIKLLITFFTAIFIGILFFAWPNKEQRDSGLLVVGTSLDYPPYEFIDRQTGQPAGLDIDIIKVIAEKLNKELVIKNMPFTSLIFGLMTGEFDMIAAGMSYTERRARLVSFTEPYLYGKTLVIFSKKSHFEPHSLQDLQGKKVAVNLGYIADMYMSKQSNIELVKLESSADCFLAIQVGTVDAFVCAQNTVQTFLKHTARPQEFAVVEIPDTQETCSFVVSKNSSNLLMQLNQAIESIKIDGTLEKIKEKWDF